MVDLEGTMTSPAKTAPAAPAAAAQSALPVATWHWPALGSAILGAIFVWLFWDFLQRQARWAVVAPSDWGHTLLIPVIAGYFGYLKWNQITSRPFRTTWAGLLPIALGVAIYAESSLGLETLRHHNIRGFGAWLTLFGLVLLFTGWRAMYWLWFPLVYLLVFGQTISENVLNLVTFRMQDITARGSAVVLGLWLDVERNGNTITIYDSGGKPRPLNIAEACSGMRMLMAFGALGVAMAYTGFKRFWQQAALVAMAVPTAIAVNILRVVSLGLLSIIDPGFAMGDMHEFIGLIWLIPAFLIFLGLMWIIGKIVIEEDAAAAA